jgi:hypothetical protein
MAGAALLARAFIEDTLALAGADGSVPWARPILATAGRMPADLILADRVPHWDQGEGDLGTRMERILSRALVDHPGAIALGVDAPALERRHLDAIRVALGSRDAVVGPTVDGGYYTLALRRIEPGLLADLPWSQPTTRAATLDRLHERGYTVDVLEEAFDVDEPADLDRLIQALRDDPGRAPRTRAALIELGLLR